MKQLVLQLCTLTIAFFYSCGGGFSQSENFELSPEVFSKKLTSNPSAVILDVRSEGEFAGSHLEHAVNANWNSDAFGQEISKLDPSAPVFVYCLSGGRSAAAAEQMRKQGFKQVFELQGGLMNWRASGFPETTVQQNMAKGMSKPEFEQMLHSDKLVLVDFYAEWCAPCKKMKPDLDDIDQNMGDKVKVMRLNADEHQDLCRTLGIASLPVLQLYKNNQLIWAAEGYVSKPDILKQLN